MFFAIFNLLLFILTNYPLVNNLCYSDTEVFFDNYYFTFSYKLSVN